MRATIEFVNPQTISVGSCITPQTPSASCASGVVATSACVGVIVTDSSCVSESIPESVCITESASESNCLEVASATVICPSGQDADAVCATPVAASVTCKTVESLSSSSCTIGSEPPSKVCNPARPTNWIPWKGTQEVDYFVLRPIYTSATGAELRTSFGVSLVALKTPTSPIYTFPTTEQFSGGGSVAMVRLTASGSTLTYNTTAGTLPLNTNIETFRPDFLHAYDTDTNTGPSEKICLSVKRLRALGFDTIDMRVLMFYINTNFNISAVGFQVSLYSGGFPQIISTGLNTRDWAFPGATLLFQETLFSRHIDRVTSFATQDLAMTFNLNLQQRYLHFNTVM